jgi:outer membrane receptor protein involved in Fe transport
LFINTLLLSTALALPAMAQIEEVVVTAQKKTEDVQNVPISITAFTGQDLQTQQIEQFKDLQFHDPSVSYTAGNFGGADFQIRGIGVTAVGYDSESGVAINFDEVFLSAPLLTESSFYDLAGVEVLAGPQSTLYGRGATGGVVNLNIAKPDLETASVQLIGSYGNYDASEVQGVVNLPLITDQLGVRVAGNWDRRDGFVTNVFNGSNVDGLDEYSLRGTLRWTPTDKTTIDITGQFSKEDDNHMRSDKALCTTDPTGVLGCLPNSAGDGANSIVNPYSGESIEAASQLAIGNALAPDFGPTLGAEIGDEIGLYNLGGNGATLVPSGQGGLAYAGPGGVGAAPGFVLPAGYTLPANARQISTSFTPVDQDSDNFLSFKWHQQILSWLDSTLIGGYDRDSFFSQQSYTNLADEPLGQNTSGYPADCGAALLGFPNVQCAQTTLPGLFALVGGPTYASYYAPYLSHPGEIPISGIGNLGLTGGNYTFTPNTETHDQSDGAQSEYSGEWRFATSFTGPLNGMLGLYYLHTSATGDYWVNSSPFDYTALVNGGLLGTSPVANPLNSGACAASGCILAPSYYHNVGQFTSLTSRALFGEVYYDAIPETLKFTAGLRYTDDQKDNSGRILIYNQFVPIGTSSENTILDPYVNTPSQFVAYTGRFVADWTPKLSFTDQTLIYASYSTGYKAGGANPGFEPALAGIVPATYRPENIDAYEVGTKNLVMNNTVQANGDVYYYTYKGLQVSAIEENTSVNENIDARVWGAEGSLVWQATDRLQLGVNAAHEESDIQNSSQVDERNPTDGDPNTILIKSTNITDGTVGQNCVAYFTGAFPGITAGLVAPPGGQSALAPYGVAHAAFGDCPTSAASAAPPGYSWVNPTTHLFAPLGVAANLDGHELQNTPALSLNFNAQYTQPLPGDFALVGRVDAHWQAHFWTSIFEDGADAAGDEYTVDASLQLNSPDNVWYAQAFVKNVTNQTNLTGAYLNSSSSGLYTNAFYGDPRTYGLQIGIKFE